MNHIRLDNAQAQRQINPPYTSYVDSIMNLGLLLTVIYRKRLSDKSLLQESH